MKTALLFILLLTATQIVAAQTARSITLAWDYSPGDSITNYYFNVRSTANATAPLPWPVMVSVTGALSASFTLSLSPNSKQFFYVTANDLRGSPTNYVPESDPSNTASVRSLPSGGLTIGKGP